MKNTIQITRQQYKSILLREHDDVNSNFSVDFDSFPKSILETLENEYGDFQNNFDWNEKTEEFRENPIEFRQWMKKNKSEQFLKKIDNIIMKTTQDMILLKRKDIAKAKLKAFEELIIPSLGNEVLSKALTKYEELILMNPNVTMEELNNGFREAKNIIDADGNINPLKTEMSKIFLGGDINIPNFERFVRKNPQYMGVYKDWEKIFNEFMDLYLIDLNAFRSSTPIQKIRELRNFLIDFKKQKKTS